MLRTVVKVRIPKLECRRCGHLWFPRKEDVRKCPKCQSVYWEQPRDEEVKA
jgi:uncharacterized OB-fold protein